MKATAQVKDVKRLVLTSVLSRMRYQPRSILLVGSHAEGNANLTSDIDLIAVVHPEKGKRFRITEQGLDAGGQPVGITYLTEGLLRRRLKLLDRLYQTGGHLGDSIATRMREAAVVLDPEGIGRTLIIEARKYKPSPNTLREVMRHSLSFYHDAWGSLSCGDAETAVIMARQAATIAVQCFLLQHGVRSLKPKWHLRRLRQQGDKGMLLRYRRVLGVDGISDKEAMRTFTEMDRLVCAVLEVPTLQDFADSPLIRSKRRSRGN